MARPQQGDGRLRGILNPHAGQVVHGGGAIVRTLERDKSRRVGYVIKLAPRASRSRENHDPLMNLCLCMHSFVLLVIKTDFLHCKSYVHSNS